MREIINKPVSTEQLLETARAIYSRGLYYDQAVFHDWTPIRNIGRCPGNRGAMHIGPGRRSPADRKARTGQCRREHIRAKAAYTFPVDSLQLSRTDPGKAGAPQTRTLRRPGLKLSWNPPEDTLLEAWLSRGDRRLAEVVYQAWKHGAKFDAWNEHFRFDAWMEAFSSYRIRPVILYTPPSTYR